MHWIHKRRLEYLETPQGVGQGSNNQLASLTAVAQAATADLIVVLDAGQVVEQGTHATLMNAGGLYQKLYKEAMICTDF